MRRLPLLPFVVALISLLSLACAYESDCFDGADDDEDGLTDSADPDCQEDEEEEEDCIPEAECCAVCSSGQACGDACISSSSSCETYGGCACDAEEVCP